jgi:putative ABC transport system permease protein
MRMLTARMVSVAPFYRLFEGRAPVARELYRTCVIKITPMRPDLEWPGEWSRLLGYAVRSLVRSPGFTAAAVLTLAVGIGATTAICSVVNTILLRPLPLLDADRLVRIVERDRPRTLPGLNYREYLDWQSRTTTLTGLAAATSNLQVVMPTPAGLVKVTAGYVSSNYFEVLGARALLGRTLLSADTANPDVMVLGYYEWQRHFGSDPGAIGSVVHFRSGGLAGRSLTVIGVMPESMETIGAPMDFYTPIAAMPNAGAIGLAQLIGRMREGAALAAAADEANVIGAAVRPPRPASAPPLTAARFDVRSLKDGMFDPPLGRQGGADIPVRSVLRIFLGAVTVVLLIVCANVANLLLARGTARRRELATRLALGASRWQLVRQILAECLVLAAAGGAIGAGFGAAGVSAIKWLATVDAQGVFKIVFGQNLLPRANEVGVDASLFGITFAVAVITTFAFGLLPALHLSRSSQLQTFGSRAGGPTRRDTRLRTLLVIGQLAMATVLLVAAGLLSASFANLAGVEKGYNPTNVLAFQLVLPGEYPTARKAESIEAVLRAIRAVPGVAAAGFSYAGILIGVQDTVGSFVPSGRAPETADRPRLKSLSAGYLESAGATRLDGRLLSEGDSAQAPPVIVINKTVQRRYFGNANPVGAFMDWHGGRGGPPVPVQVVGVIADVRQGALHREPYAEIFMDYRQVIALQQRWGLPAGAVDHLAFGFMSFAMRTRDDPTGLIPQVRQAITRADPNAALDSIMPMDSLVANSVARQRFYAVMLAAFAAVAALLGAIGIYGVLACFVVERTREIGLRMALGAGRRQVLGLVLGRGLACAAFGITVGLAGAAAGTRYVQAMLYGITPLDGRTFTVVAVAFVAVAALASYVPARHATGLDPMVALRLE